MKNYQRANEVTISETLLLLFQGKAKEPIFLAGLSLVDVAAANRENEIEVASPDENGCMSYSVTKIEELKNRETNGQLCARLQTRSNSIW